MGENTGISWTDSTFNPWVGCTKVSPGCQFCYAEALNKRFGKDVWGLGKSRERTTAANWRKPILWNKQAAAAGVRRKVFCASMADWLDPEVPAEWLADLLVLIAATPMLDWQLLTKRPELWRERMAAVIAHGDAKTSRWADKPAAVAAGAWLTGVRIPPNVWVGTTVEDQKRANERIPALLAIPARVRFLSCEPLLEAVDLFACDRPANGGAVICDYSPTNTALGDLDWIIVGGESGPNARPFDLAWARRIVQDCKAAGVAVFVKQMGDKPQIIDEPCYDPLCSCGTNRLQFKAHHGADPAEWPEDLRVQEFPNG